MRPLTSKTEKGRSMLARRRTEWLGRVTGERVDARLVAGELLRKMREHVHRVAYIQKSPARVCAA